jgi:hypothetical protein
MDYLDKILVVAVVGGVIWWALQPRYVFLVRIQRGLPRVARGKVTAHFVQQLAEVLEASGVTGGWVGGVVRGRQVSLRFSGNIPPGCRQQLRNVWPTCG